jgi:hypothetical protein
MNEVGYRFEQRPSRGLVAGNVVFGGLSLLCLGLAVVAEPVFGLLAVFWLVPLAGGLLEIRNQKRGHLFFGPDHVTQLGWRDRMLPIQSIARVKWRPITRQAKLYSPSGNMTVSFAKFAAPDRVKIIHELRTRSARAKHLQWPRFCHQYAVKLLDKLDAAPLEPDPVQEPVENEYVVSRKRFGAEWGVVSVIVSLGWLAMVALASTDSLQLNELLASRQLAMQSSAMAVVPILAIWIFWSLLVWRYPREGRIGKKEVRNEADRKSFKRVKTFGIPMLVFGAIWTIATKYALESVFGFSPDLAAGLAMLTFLAIFMAVAATGGLLHNEEINKTDFEPSLNRWHQYEQAQQKIRRPRIPGRRQQEPYIIK